MQQPPVVPPVVPVVPPVVPPVPPVPPIPPVPPAGGAVPGPVRVFVITPAHRVRDFLDFANCNEYQTWMYGIEPLVQDQKFDCRESNLKKFLDAYASKEQQMGWDEVFTIPVNGVQRHVPTEWGSLTSEWAIRGEEIIFYVRIVRLTTYVSYITTLVFYISNALNLRSYVSFFYIVM